MGDAHGRHRLLVLRFLEWRIYKLLCMIVVLLTLLDGRFSVLLAGLLRWGRETSFNTTLGIQYDNLSDHETVRLCGTTNS